MVYLLLTYNLFHIADLSLAAIHAKAERGKTEVRPSLFRFRLQQKIGAMTEVAFIGR
jgi:hypothetical protein